MNLAACTLVVLFGACNPAAAQTPAPRSSDPPKELGAVLEARAVRLAKPTVFWRAGEQVSITAGALLRVRVHDPFLFAPRGNMPPMFVYGSAVCEVLRSPMADGEAVLLAPHVLPGEAPVLWIASPSEPGREKLVALSGTKGRELGGVMVKLAPAAGERVYKDVDELRQEIQSRTIPRQ